MSRARPRASRSPLRHLTFNDIADKVIDGMALRRSMPGTPVRLHTHAYFELVLVSQGEATHHFAQHDYRVGTHDLLAVSPWIPHRYTIPKAAERFAITTINFGFDALIDALDDPTMMSMVTLLAQGKLQGPNAFPGLFRPVPDTVQTCIDRMEEEVANLSRSPGASTILSSLLRIVLIEMYRHRDAAFSVDESSETAPILRSLPWIHSMATSADLSLRDIAEGAFLSPSYFGRRFKELIGESVTQYVQRVRVARALQMLATTDLSIDEVAAGVGYKDPGTFRSVFRQVTGSTPSKYRQHSFGGASHGDTLALAH